jgi:hypothetical protein
MSRLRILMAALVASFALAAAFLVPVHAASVLPLYLDEMIDTSAVAFEGRVTANRTVRDEATRLVVTYTTFEVLDVLKGPVGATHEIKQIGGSLPGEGVEYRVPGIPSFHIGEEYVVFLAGVSSLGFSSPIGLSQGRFGIDASDAGRGVGNGRDFRDMTARMADRLPATAQARMLRAAEPVRRMDLDDFKRAVRAHLDARR